VGGSRRSIGSTRDELAPLRWPGKIGGTVTSLAASLIGVSEETPVIVGTSTLGRRP
jgi:sugar (pentulose or hexulose) kinase